MALTRREPSRRHPDAFDRLVEGWPTWLRRPMMFWPEGLEEMLRVDEYREDDTEVVRAEVAGIDPEKDVEITVSDGMLHIEAQRREEEKKEEKHFRRHELRYGSFSRDLPLPEGATEADVKASYRDGILEVRIPVPKAAEAKADIKKIPVTKG